MFVSKLLGSEVPRTKNLYAILVRHYQGLLLTVEPCLFDSKILYLVSATNVKGNQERYPR